MPQQRDPPLTGLKCIVCWVLLRVPCKREPAVLPLCSRSCIHLSHAPFSSRPNGPDLSSCSSRRRLSCLQLHPAWALSGPLVLPRRRRLEQTHYPGNRVPLVYLTALYFPQLDFPSHSSFPPYAWPARGDAALSWLSLGWISIF